MKPKAPTAPPQLEKRGGTIDERIAKLDAELRKHKEIIDRARPGPAKARPHAAASSPGAQRRGGLSAHRPRARPGRRRLRSSARCGC